MTKHYKDNVCSQQLCITVNSLLRTLDTSGLRKHGSYMVIRLYTPIKIRDKYMRAKFHKAWCQQSTVWPNKCYMMDSSSKVNLQCLSSAKVNVCFFVLMYIFTGESQEQACIRGSATEAVMEKKNTAKQVHVSCLYVYALPAFVSDTVERCVGVLPPAAADWERESCITSYNQWWGCLAAVYSFLFLWRYRGF